MSYIYLINACDMDRAIITTGEYRLGVIIPHESVQLPDRYNKIQQIITASGL